MSINQENLSLLLEYAKTNHRYQTILHSGLYKYQIDSLNLEKVRPELIHQQIKHNLSEKAMNFKTNFNGQNSEENVVWGHFQYKIFAWVSIIYSSYAKRDLHRFIQDDITYLLTLFPNKSRQMITYHIYCLAKDTSKAKLGWDQEQCQLLLNITQEFNRKKAWCKISFQLFVRSEGKFFRTREKCREQWFNHLDPSLKKGNWTIEQDIFLMEAVIENGKRWSRISKIINPKRTQHMIKNRYHSLLMTVKRKFKVNKNIDGVILQDLKKRYSEQRQIDQNNNKIQISLNNNNPQNEVELIKSEYDLNEQFLQKDESEIIFNFEEEINLLSVNQQRGFFNRVLQAPKSQILFFDSHAIQKQESSVFHQMIV